jgi:hypothetical protein
MIPAEIRTYINESETRANVALMGHITNLSRRLVELEHIIQCPALLYTRFLRIILKTKQEG